MVARRSRRAQTRARKSGVDAGRRPLLASRCSRPSHPARSPMTALSRPVVRILLLVTATLVLGAAAKPGAPGAKSAPSGTKSPGIPAPVLTAGRAIEGARLEQHVKTLADDRMEGRGTG